MSTSTAATTIFQNSAHSFSLLAALGDRGQRQLELTLGSLARSVRRAIRGAELLDREPQTTPAAREAAWNVVNQRSATLCQFMAALQPPPAPVAAPSPAPEAPAEAAPVSTSASVAKTGPAPEPRPAAKPSPAPAAASPLAEIEAEIQHVAQMARFPLEAAFARRERWEKIMDRIRLECPPAQRQRLIELIRKFSR